MTSKRGRKTKYTPEVVERITHAIRLGATHRLACLYAGVSHETFYRWLSEKPDFYDAVKLAEGAGAVGWLAKIEQAAQSGEWTAAAWKLERRYPDEYGRRVQDTRLSGGDGGPIRIETYDYGAAAAALGPGHDRDDLDSPDAPAASDPATPGAAG